MAFSRKHHLVMVTPDDPAYENKPSNWNEPHDVEDAVSGGIPYFSSTTTEGTSALLAAGGIVVGGGVGTAPLTYTNLTYSEASGPRLQVGSGDTTSAGFTFGYTETSGYAGLWHTGIATKTIANTTLYADKNGNISLGNPNAGGTVILNNKFDFYATAGRGVLFQAGTATTDVNALSATQTWNASGVAFTGWKFTITDTASAAGSLAMQILGGAAGTKNLISLDKNGGLDGPVDANLFSFTAVKINNGINSAQPIGLGGTLLLNSSSSTKGVVLGLDFPLSFADNTNANYSTMQAGVDTQIKRVGANSLCFGASSATAGSVTSRTEINKAVTAFTDAVAKTVFTLTIPNAAHSASYLVRVTGSIGAGGAIGANEASATNCYVVTLTRTAGVNATAAISAAFGASATNVAGATTVTCTAALAAVSGAVGASNTIDIQATITKAGGASDNHTCVATASLLNANASGITIS